MPARAAEIERAIAEVQQLTAQVHELVVQMSSNNEHNSNSQTFIHRTEGMSTWGVAAVVACFCTWFGLVGVMFDLHDQRAWVDQFRSQITVLKQDVATLKERAK